VSNILSVMLNHRISSDTNLVAPSGGSMETLVAAGSMTLIHIPSVTTVIHLASPTLSIATSLSTSVSGSSTKVETLSSTITQGVGVTLGPGGEIIGTVPTSVSQPGFTPPVFGKSSVLCNSA
jgi:hypothetical protein